MIRFFRSIRKSLLSSFALRKYLVYAVGEILLVMIGILLALQVNNWNESRKLKTEEMKTLTQLLESLKLESGDLEINAQTIKSSIKSIDIIEHHLNQRLPYHDSLDYHFGNSGKMMGFIVTPAVYEKLKFSGLDLISSDSLRNNIVNHYDYLMPYLVQIEKGLVQPLFNTSVRPAMLEKFDYRGIFSPASPIDYFSLVDDRQYFSLIITFREAISFQLGRTESLLESAMALQSQVAGELSRAKD